MEYLDGFDYDQPVYSYTRDGSWWKNSVIKRNFSPMMPMIMIPTFGREVWWTIEEAISYFPEETIQQASSKPFL